MEAFIHTVALHLKSVLDLVVISLIAVGCLCAAGQLIRAVFKGIDLVDSLKPIRQTLARWIIIALEFAIASDVLLTAIIPSWEELGMLTAIVLLRFFLTYTLDMELSSQTET